MATSRVNIEGLRGRLGLTPRQAQLTARLAEGATLSQASMALGVTVNTSRWHLREIFEKTNTHRQTDLVRLVLLISNEATPPPDAA
jgi:DNA-binding CsgD family transcriptional regulator